MGKKVYAIKKGYDFEGNRKIENMIVSTWSECLKYVQGVKGAVYKSFVDTEEANRYLDEGSKLLKKDIGTYPYDCLHIYVDGSYNNFTEEYSYGLIAVREDVVQYIESGASKDDSKKSIRQIAGELMAAVRAVEYALETGESKVVIIHDYEGICYHATGFWDRKEESSIRYYNRMNELMSRGIEVIFVKVDSHTGDFYNELVDEKCKEKINIDSDKFVDKWLSDNSLKVKNKEVKNEILSIAPGKSNKIEIINNISEIKDKEKDIISFKDMIEEYRLDKENTMKIISTLSDIQKTNFIVYLLNHKNY